VNAVPGMAFAVVLALAAALAILVGARAKPAARNYLHFATALYIALAFADFLASLDGGAWKVQLAQTVSLIVASLAPVALTLAAATAFESPPPAMLATPVLVLSCLAGLAAAATGEAFIAFAPLVASVCAALALCVRHWRTDTRAPLQVCAAALALLAGAAAFESGGRTAFALFSATALLGVSLAAIRRSHRAVEQKMPRLEARTGISRQR
jgi:hypothetical protein